MKRSAIVVGIARLAALISVEVAAQSSPPSSPKAREVEALVNSAAALIEAKGKMAFSEFRVKDSEWFHGDTQPICPEQQNHRHYCTRATDPRKGELKPTPGHGQSSSCRTAAFCAGAPSTTMDLGLSAALGREQTSLNGQQPTFDPPGDSDAALPETGLGCISATERTARSYWRPYWEERLIALIFSRATLAGAATNGLYPFAFGLSFSLGGAIFSRSSHDSI